MGFLTRSKDEPSRSLESGLAKIGYQLKTRTTSQTLDMVRTALDIAEFTDPPLPQFRLFVRTNQKVWDGLAASASARRPDSYRWMRRATTASQLTWTYWPAGTTLQFDDHG